MKKLFQILIPSLLITSGIIFGGLFIWIQGMNEDATNGDIDTTSPTITIISPKHDGNYLNTTLLLEINASDKGSEIDLIWYNWNGKNETYLGKINVTFNLGTNTLRAWVNDTAGNINNINSTFTTYSSSDSEQITYLSDTFVSVWDTTNFCADRMIKLPLHSNGDYNFTVDWGDGSQDLITTWNQPEVYHTFATDGRYTISIKGKIIGWWTQSLTYALTEIRNWGCLQLGNSGSYFSGCHYLYIIAADFPNLTGTTNFENAFLGCDLYRFDGINDWDMSKVTDMSGMFSFTTFFNSDISDWNVSNVSDMSSMFEDAYVFNQDIGNWDVSNVKNMNAMFKNARLFNQDLNQWNVSNVKDMDSMFAMSDFYMYESNFNQPLGNWNVSKVTDMSSMFENTYIFNQDISEWDVSNVTDMSYMFKNANSFNQPIKDWDVSNVSSMKHMFYKAHSFNQDLSTWDISKVEDITAMFKHAINFDQDISGWDISKIDSLVGVFQNATNFNQDLSGWDVTRINNMESMFEDAVSFNQDLSAWEVLNVNYMSNMFQNASAFNQDISGWNVSSVYSMDGMFWDAISFDQDLGNWNVSKVSTMENMFNGITLSTINYDSMLIGWEGLSTLISEVIFDGGNSKYSSGAAATARQSLIDDQDWTITDGGQAS